MALIPSYLAASLLPDGVYRSDDRFRVIEEGGAITVFFNGRATRHPTAEAAVHWMLQQPAPTGSMRLGNSVAKITSALGIPKCGACANRQLALNGALRTK